MIIFGRSSPRRIQRLLGAVSWIRIHRPTVLYISAHRGVPRISGSSARIIPVEHTRDITILQGCTSLQAHIMPLDADRSAWTFTVII